MSVLDREALEQSPLADLHTIASELSIDGYRRLRRAELIAAIVAKQDGVQPTSTEDAGDSVDAESPAGDAPAAESVEEPTPAAEPTRAEEPTPAAEPTPAEPSGDEKPSAADAPADDADEERPAGRRRRGRRGGRGRSETREEAGPSEPGPSEPGPSPARDKAPDQDREEPEQRAEAPAEDELVEGVVELLANGSGFARVDPPEPSDNDVYISAAQVKRCELVSGDRISGPKRTPRRSERFASLVRIDTINGKPAAELADSVHFDDLPAAFPDERFRLGSEDPTLKAIEWLTPFGKGSRVTIVGSARSGKTEALRRLAAALAGLEGFQLSVVLAGVRPEEIFDWRNGPVAPAAAVSFAASADTQGSTIEPVLDQARRLAARGADAIVLLDTLDGLHPHTARKALAAARNIVDGGSLTVIATASAPLGGETSVIALDASLASTGRFPAVDLVASGTIRPELLVGEAAAAAIARSRAEAGEED